MICKIKKETNKILSYLFKYYWNNDEESVIFIKEIFKQMFLKEMNLNYENKIQNLLDNSIDYFKEYVIPFLKNLMEFEIEIMLALNKKNGIENKRNGYKTRIINTIFGTYELEIPRDRLAEYFPSFLQRRVSALACLVKRIIADLKVTQNQSLVRKCLSQAGINLSKTFISSVYNMMHMKANSLYFKRVFPSKIDAIMLDATYVYVKKNGEKWQIIDDYTGEVLEYKQAQRVCVLQAYGINFEDNSKIDLGFKIVNKENIANYVDF
ncbi:MAG: transposase [Ureaplasma sp.]|nr:transposase [Ureaplasma sp.]